MVPTTIVELAELPRTPRGKVDHDALEAAGGTMLRAPERAASTDLEIYISEIWRNVLGIHDVGIDDDFFELGGDSLAVEEVLSELQKLGPDLPTAVFIDSPTIAGLAAAAEIGATARLSSGLIEMRRAVGAPTMVCFAGAGGIAVAFEPLVRSLDIELRIIAVQMHALEYRGIPDFSVLRAARRFLAAFRELGIPDPQVIIGHSYGGSVALEVARGDRTFGWGARCPCLRCSIHLRRDTSTRPTGHRIDTRSDGSPRLPPGCGNRSPAIVRSTASPRFRG